VLIINELRLNVAQIHENHRAELTDALHPADKRNCLAYIRYAEFTTSVCSVHILLIYNEL
jgi:hypothetical protein